MTELSYTDVRVNTNLSNLSGYLDQEASSFRVIDKSFSSWSFNGSVPSAPKNIVIWDRANRNFNFGPGDYIVILDSGDIDVSTSASNYQITRVFTDPSLDFFDDTLSPQGKRRSTITAVSGNGTTVTYTANNSFQADQQVRVSGILPAGYSFEKKLIISATSTTFTVAGTQTGTADLTDDETYVELVTSFLSDVYVKYLDDDGVEQTYTIEPILFEGYPVNRLNVIHEGWENKILGSDGWLLTAAGNAIFNNVAVRGEIEATSGNFSGNLTINNGEMKIGSSVSNDSEYTISEVEILNNKILFKTSAPSELSIFTVGDTITVSDLEFTETGYMNLNGTFIVSYVDSDQVGHDFVTPDAGPFTVTTGKLSNQEGNDGVYINPYNYWYDDGHFKIGSVDSTVTWNPDISLLNITGDISASQIRGTDVYANSAQLGGNEFGWVIGSGDIFSGTYGSTSYLKSGFYSIPVTDFEQETEVVGGKTIVKVRQVSGSARLSGNPRGIFVDINNSSLTEIKVGYQLYETSLVNNIEVRGDFIGIVEEIISPSLIKLKNSPSKFYDNIRFGVFYVNTTITSQFTVFEKLPVDGSGNASLSLEGPLNEEYHEDYHAKNIPVVVNSSDSRIITTKSVPPVWNVDKTPKEYLEKTLFLSLSDVLDYKKESNIARIRTVKTILANEDEAYNSYIYALDADKYVPGDVIFVSNISRYYDEVTALNGSYLPVIKVGQDTFGKYVLVYTDGYLGDANDVQFPSVSVTSIKIESGEVTLQTSAAHRLDVGQMVSVRLFGIKEIVKGSLNAYNLNIPGDLPFTDSAIITEVSTNTIKYRKNLTNLISTSVGSGSTASSSPSMNTKESDKSYSFTVGSSKPDDAPFQIDQFGENVKIKNLEVTGSVTGFYYDIIELDDFSGNFDGRNNTFLPRYNQKKIVLDNPMRLSVSLNGVMQSAFIQNREYVWQTGFLSYKGFTIDGDGKLKFSESPPSGSTINVKVLPGPNKNKTSRIYPFKAVDVALG
jgi:hypothetical protein